MAHKTWGGADLSRAGAIPDEAALGFVRDRVGERKNALDEWLFELLLRFGEARKAALDG